MPAAVKDTDTWTEGPPAPASDPATASPMGTAQFSTEKTPPSFRASVETVSPVLVRAVKVATVSVVYSFGVALTVRYHSWPDRL